MNFRDITKTGIVSLPFNSRGMQILIAHNLSISPGDLKPGHIIALSEDHKFAIEQDYPGAVRVTVIRLEDYWGGYYQVKIRMPDWKQRVLSIRRDLALCLYEKKRKES